MKKYVDNYEKWSYEKCVAYWCQVVGWAQRLLPTYLAQEYCQPNCPFFYSVPDFTKTEFARTLDFFDWVSNSDASWFPLGTSKLGSDFGILRGLSTSHSQRMKLQKKRNQDQVLESHLV